MKTTTCISCGCVFGMPDELYDQLLRAGTGFNCPNGHSQHFIKQPTKEQREIERLRERLAATWQETGEAWEAHRVALKELRRCPLCGESTSRARNFPAISEALAIHLREEHGAKQRLRSLPAAGQTGTGL